MPRSLQLVLLTLIAVFGVAVSPAAADIPSLSLGDAGVAVTRELDERVQAVADEDDGQTAIESFDSCVSLAGNVARCAGHIVWAPPMDTACGADVYVRRLPAGTLRDQPAVLDFTFSPYWACDNNPVPVPPATGITVSQGAAEALKVTKAGLSGDTLVRFDDDCEQVDKWTVACRRIISTTAFGPKVWSTSAIWVSNRFGAGKLDSRQADAIEFYDSLAGATALYDVLGYEPATVVAPPPAAPDPPAASAPSPPPVPQPVAVVPAPVVAASPGPPVGGSTGKPATRKRPGAPAQLAVTGSGRTRTVKVTCRRERCVVRLNVRVGDRSITRSARLKRGAKLTLRVTARGKRVRAAATMVNLPARFTVRT